MTPGAVNQDALGFGIAFDDGGDVRDLAVLNVVGLSFSVYTTASSEKSEPFDDDWPITL
jgi:hypothetical protein